jgi:hypothetical protein
VISAIMGRDALNGRPHMGPRWSAVLHLSMFIFLSKKKSQYVYVARVFSKTPLKNLNSVNYLTPLKGTIIP